MPWMVDNETAAEIEIDNGEEDSIIDDGSGDAAYNDELPARKLLT